MITSYFKVLSKFKTSSFLNIIGMAVAFSAFYVILTQVQWGLTYNQKVKDSDRIFLITTPSPTESGKIWGLNSRPMVEPLIEAASCVEAFGEISFYHNIPRQAYYIRNGETVRKIKVICNEMTQGAIDVFGIEVKEGSFKDMEHSGSVAISSSIAEEYGLKVGDLLSASPTGEPAGIRIVAIFKDSFQKNSAPGSLEMIFDIKDKSIEDYSEASYPYYVKLHDASQKEEFENSANKALMDFIEEFDSSPESAKANYERLKITLVPLTELYYRNDLDFTAKISRVGNKPTDLTLLAIAILIIVICIINFVNFFIALVPARVKNVNTNKVLGASRSSLVFNFMAEAAFTAAIALIIAYAITILFLNSPFSDVLNASAEPTANISVLILTILVALGATVAGSVYPALYITSFHPAIVLKGSFSTSKTGRMLRNILIGIQFTVSIVLMISAIFVKLQHQYMMNQDMGFNRENLITGEMPISVAWWNEKNQLFEDKLKSNPDIVDLTWSDGVFIRENRMSWGRVIDGRRIEVQVQPVAYNFLDFMGIEIIEGRSFKEYDEQCEDGVIIFNDKARKEYNMTLGHNGPSHNGNDAEVAGICFDFNSRPVKQGPTPFAFYIFGQDHSWRNGLSHLYVRTTADADPNAVINYIRKTIVELLPGEDVDEVKLGTFEEELGMRYEDEKTLSQLTTIFSVIAIMLSLMGVLGIVLFETEHRRKEIATRRVMGAETSEILWMFNKKYALIVCMCFIIAAPVSWIIVERYLSTFAYRTPIHFGVFAMVFVAILVLIVTIVTVRSYNTVMSNPVNSLKSE